MGAWAAALAYDGPSVIALTRQGVPALGDKPGGALEAVANGAYVLRDTDDEPDVVLMGTGSEVQLAVEAAVALADDGIAARVVSMPSWEAFAARPVGERDRVIPPAVRARVAVEAAASFGWHRWVGDAGRVVAVDRFGASAPAADVYAHLGITVDAVVEAARASRRPRLTDEIRGVRVSMRGGGDGGQVAPRRSRLACSAAAARRWRHRLSAPISTPPISAVRPTSSQSGIRTSPMAGPNSHAHRQ